MKTTLSVSNLILYFSLNKSQKINILNIYENESVNNFNYLFKDTSMFSYKSSKISNIQYSEIIYQDFVILNEINSCSDALEKYLIQILKKGSNITLIILIFKLIILINF